ncbi:helix-turn-helix domain-containing protein [Pseudomonas multiresinivorans]|uniref:Helix-turn-helix transcriptional regulator n=1 Tax=Pseudomonas multiresinivorans TaxID=95301 RepID=A0A7Z3BN44_9PSED|nr:helix-turn-helix transcriptional regulator [Pseudomonas multiresinivorans]QJP09972.1 helix-turn-helix transcriptional regulator [Pseudomonas multiresinivorans]
MKKLRTVKDRAAFYDDLISKLSIGAPVDFGATVRLLRKKVTGMNQEEFALACRIDVVTLKRLERNLMSPDLEMLGDILYIFGLQLTIIRQDRNAWRWSAVDQEFIRRHTLKKKAE